MSSPGLPGGDATDAALDNWVADAEAMAARYQQLSTDVQKVSVSETTPDGLISVTVDSGGLVTDLRITERATGMPGPKIAAGVLWAMRRAQSRIAAQVAEVMRSSLGEDTAMADAVLNRYQTTFPAPPPQEPARPPVVDEVRIGTDVREAREAVPTPAPVRAPARRAAAATDDWDGGNDSFLEEVDR